MTDETNADRVRAAIAGMDTAFARLGDALSKWESPADRARKRAELEQRRDTLRRQASAALGRGDRRTHRHAVEAVRRIDREMKR